MTKYQTHFKRDAKPVLEIIYKTLDQLIIVGDIFLPLLKDKLLDEVRFKNDYISFIKNGEIFNYEYKQVEVTVQYSSPVFSFFQPKVEFIFKTKDDEYNINLNKIDSNLFEANLSGTHRDFLYNIGKKIIRIREKQVKDLMLFKILMIFTLIVSLLY